MAEAAGQQAPQVPSEIAQMSFEEALEELRQIVSRLESGEGQLDQAIDAYERGAHLKAHCEAKLREAQAKIEMIALGPDGAARGEPFEGS
ncbi:exodeoxyribonuclease VII small subunit [Algihabitans albus]|uniref:exodeoxyribonuclease VII small subunit n=1 Tax=Algihabitans albus TaxID=2164067 RepID=UPI000E5CEB35|nr:exodeoxyribonuclease VII small subunit [Algihabitans albus]